MPQKSTTTRARNPETNIKFVRRLMENSPHGALSQIFILAAIDSYAKHCIKAGPAACDSPLINGHAWVRTATWIKEELEQRP